MYPLTFKDIRPVEAIESTYTYLIKLKEQQPTLPSGAYVAAEYQTAGRGQQGNSWYSTPGASLIPSFLIQGTGLHISEGWSVSEWVALSLRQAVATYLPRPELLSIKWPNDLYYGDNKLAGILISHTLEQDQIFYSVIGVGLNVNEPKFPSDIPNPISMMQIVGSALSLADVERAFKRQLTALYPDLCKSRGRKLLHQSYLQHLYRMQRKSTFRNTANGTHFEGSIVGIAEDGRLRIVTEKGEEIRFAFKEVAYL